MFKNMKIPVENNLDEIVAELEKKGYKKDFVTDSEPSFVITWGSFGIYDIQGLPNDQMTSHNETTILAELKEME